MLFGSKPQVLLSFPAKLLRRAHFVQPSETITVRRKNAITQAFSRSSSTRVASVRFIGLNASSSAIAARTAPPPVQFRSYSGLCLNRLPYAPNTVARTMTSTAQPKRLPVSVQEITSHLQLITEQPRNVKLDSKTLRLHKPLERPLVIMPAWLLAKRKPLLKYAEIYVKLGFDVLTIKISPWQLLWPAKGTQLVGLDVINFLHHNTAFAPLLLHGFSVGAYVWGECMVYIHRDPQRYGHIAERIVGQVWDSAADITEIPVGVPKAVFPNNPRLNRALGNYMEYHLRTFHDIATQHYLLSSQMFHNNLVRAPALMFVSEDDPVGSVSSNDCVRRDWERIGIDCEWKCWARSEHVSHYMRHREEYLETLYAHLERLQLMPQSSEAERNERPAEKLRAKL